MILGMIRYAVPISNGEFEKNSKQLEDLYKEPYFSDRFKLFCGITLESFVQQTDKDFLLFIYHTKYIPEDKKILFDNLETKYKFLKNIYIDNNKLYIPDEYKEEKLLTFRIDNDDGVAKDFVSKLNKLKNETKDINFAITIPKIRKIMRIDKDKFKTISFDYPKKTHSMGLAYYSNNGKTIIDLGDHTKIYERFPTKLLSGQGGLQILNGYNVGNSIGGAKIILNKNNITKLLNREGYANLNLNCLPIIK